MLDVHRTLSEHGLEGARRVAATKTERAAVEAAAYLAAHPSAAGDRIRTSLIAAALPHKAPKPASRGWRRPLFGGGELSLESGLYLDGAPVGVPYGSKARLILMFLQDQAITGGAPRATLGASMNAWVRAMGGSAAGGMTYKTIGIQAQRIASCRFGLVDARGRAWSGRFVERLIGEDTETRWDDIPYRRDAASEPFPNAAALGEPFFQASLATRVDVDGSALRCISNNSAAMDIYLCLAAYLPKLGAPEVVAWSDLAPGFGAGYRDPGRMRPALLRALQMALAVYAQAEVEVVPAGLRLLPSEPPVPPPN